MMNTLVFLISVQAGLQHAAGVSSHLAVPANGAAEALMALDTDKSGKVERAEVEAFAQSQGLTAEQVRLEFKDLDLNGDGELSADEISNTLQEASPAMTQASTPARIPDIEPPAPAVAMVAPAAPAMQTIVAAAPPSTVAVAQMDTQMDDQMAAVAFDAQQHAGKALAEVFARSAAKALEARSEDELQAAKLEEQAKSLRGKSSEMKRTAATLTIKAATDAAVAVMRESAAQEKALEQEAAQAEKDANARRKQAQAAMQKAVKAQADMSSSLQDLQTKS